MVEKREILSGTFLVKDGKMTGENLLKADFFRFSLDGHMHLWLSMKFVVAQSTFR
ncbi:hypothetical protein ACFP1I_07700 [Dyadobacter subterraneus]|uniref:YceI-like domain-containing protein n=1 Tax=Dyadobacter subterraneus TaxID=2773304 RepID=A0ABR9WEX7_9BACT|nr:hypothetical protein [Dyadobacter subterraneus]MBE9463982.1 hypothetical protein [Dyadobacter subterraneus]